jgi:outer membrane protein assembly factor BamD (BamD/ComL family)
MTNKAQKELDAQVKKKRELDIKARNKERELLAKERKRKMDSTLKAREIRSDSIAKARKKIQKEKDKIAKYKSSRKYTDSIDRVRKERTDSITLARKLKTKRDQQLREEKAEVAKVQLEQKIKLSTEARERRQDSISEARKEIAEKKEELRKKKSDSLTQARKTKEQLAADKRKAQLEKLAKGYKSQEQKMMEEGLKEHERKKSNYSNQNFLKKPWTLNRQIFQNTVTRYNYYYNARNKYNNTLAELSKSGKTNYDSLLSIDALSSNDSKAASGNMDSVIRKTNMSIQIHDPRSKWFDDLYLLMGKAYYSKGEYEDALATFQYIASEYKPKPKPLAKVKLKKVADTVNIPSNLKASEEKRGGVHLLAHHPIRNDALLWMIKSYLKLGAVNDAMNILGYAEADVNFPKRLKGELNLLAAKINLESNSREQAIVNIKNAIKQGDYSKENERKLYFLLGQLFQLNEEYKASDSAFNKVVKMMPDPEMDFFAKLNLAKNASHLEDANMNKVVDMFEKIIGDGKYIDFKDRAYLTLGAILMNSNPEKAINNFEKAIKLSKQSNIKSEAYLNIADIHYKNEKYELAKSSYDSTLVLWGSTMTHPRFQEVNYRGQLLQDLVKELDVIRMNDSLLALSLLSEKDQIKNARKTIKKINSDKKAKIIAANAQVPETGAVQQDKNWYFNNQNTVASGQSKFIQKWGERPNADNWRRMAALQSNPEELVAGDSTGQIDEQEEALSQVSIKDYLQAIPKTDEQKALLLKGIENSYYNASVVFYAGLENYRKAITYLDTLNERFPENEFKEQSLYTQVLSYKKLENLLLANGKMETLKTKFPNSKYINMYLDTTYSQQLDGADLAINILYEDAYKEFKQDHFDIAIRKCVEASQKFATHKLMPKFSMIHSLSLIGKKEIAPAKEKLNSIINENTGSEEATLAQDVLILLNQVDSTQSDSSITTMNVKPSFEQNVNNGSWVMENYAPHYFILILKVIDDKLYPTRSAFNDYNKIKQSAFDLEASLSLINANSGLLVFKTFEDAQAAKKYLKDIQGQKILYANYKNDELDMAIISEKNFELFQQTRNLESYIKFYKQNYK